MTSVARISFLVLLLLLPWSVYSDGLDSIPGRPVPEKQERKIGSAKGQDEQRKVEKPPLKNQERCSCDCNCSGQNTSNEKPSRFSWEWWTDSPQTIINIGIFVFTVLAGTGAIWAAIGTRHAANAATKSADASTLQAQIAEETFREFERPWVFLTPHQHWNADAPFPKYLCFSYSSANYGKTPAILLGVAWDKHIVARIDDDATPNWSTHPSSNTRILSTQTPGNEHVDGTEIPLYFVQSEAEHVEFFMRKKHLIVLFRVSYEDVFRKTHECTQGFRFNFESLNFERWGGDKYNRYT